MVALHKEKVGLEFITNEGYKIKVIEYFTSVNCTIQFESGEIVKNVRWAAIIKGNIRNKNRKCVYGIGYHGYGAYKGIDDNGKETKSYGTWRGMLRRCYYEKHIEQHSTYKGCQVTEEWHNFQNFAKWFEHNFKPWMDNNWQLDKDILIKGNKIYSPETCCFVPREINATFINNNSNSIPKSIRKYTDRFRVVLYKNNKSLYLGTFFTLDEAVEVYKKEKEKHIKELANKWREYIDHIVYKTLINYKVSID